MITGLRILCKYKRNTHIERKLFDEKYTFQCSLSRSSIDFSTWKSDEERRVGHERRLGKGSLTIIEARENGQSLKIRRP